MGALKHARMKWAYRRHVYLPVRNALNGKRRRSWAPWFAARAARRKGWVWLDLKWPSGECPSPVEFRPW